jgi:para-aminobenzoate synthetase component I
MNKNEFIKMMNFLGAEKLPFLYIIDFDFSKSIIVPISEVNPDKILFKTDNYSNSIDEKCNLNSFQFEKEPVSFEHYSKAFDIVLENILNGNSYLLNLTFPTKIKTTLSLKEIFKYSRSKYKLFIENHFVCFSPEIFVKITGNTISSYPMKGTIDADLPNALDIILNDDKEFAEHNTIVDLIRNDLSIVSKNVRVNKFRYADYLKTSSKKLIQISSEICGDLPDDWQSRLGDIFEKLLPAGSITGAPKKKTVEIIREAEGYDRGYYTGVFGVFDGQNIDSAVMIRYIEQTENGLIFKSGGGITSMSDVNSEYQELIDKVYVPIY